MPTTAISAPTAVQLPPSTDASLREPRRIWDGTHQSFNVGPLRDAMLVRGFTADSLAYAAGVARATLYNALKGRPTRLSTARRIIQALSGAPATLDLSAHRSYQAD